MSGGRGCKGWGFGPFGAGRGAFLVATHFLGGKWKTVLNKDFEV